MSVKQPSGHSHFVVMDGDGRVFDPMREGAFSLADWSSVLTPIEVANRQRTCPTCEGTGINPVAKRLTCPKCDGEGCVTEKPLTPTEVAERARLSLPAVYRAIAAGELRSSKLRGLHRISEAELERWIAEALVEPAEPDQPVRRRPRRRPEAPRGRFGAS